MTTKTDLIIDTSIANRFIFGGKAYFTLISKKTNRAYSYLVHRKDNNPFWFVYVKENSVFNYAGFIRICQDRYIYDVGSRGKYGAEDNRILTFMWFLTHMEDNDINSKIIIAHEGHVARCCKCGKLLTDVESIRRGAGVECAKIIFGGK